MELKRRKRNSHTPMSTTGLHLPDDIWESVFKFFNQADDGNDMKSLSLVSKQFLSITNRLRFSLTICDPTLPCLRGLLKRFTNLTSLNITTLNLTPFRGDVLNKLLCQIARFPLNITSLNLSNKFTESTFPSNGLLTFSKKITTLTSLTYSNIYYINYTDLVFIADCFPLLEQLDLSSPYGTHGVSGVQDPHSLTLFKLRKVRLVRQGYINDQLLFHLFKNCKNLEEAIILYCHGITDAGIASALAERPTLRSLSLSEKPYNDITSHFIDSLVSLKGLTCLDLHSSKVSDDLLYSIAREGLPLTKLVLIDCYDYSYAGIICLLTKCRQSLQHLNLQHVDFLNDQHVVEFSLLLGNLVFINLSGCKRLTESALFALVRNCASLSEIQIEKIWRKDVENPDSLMDFGVYPQLKSLNFANTRLLNNESIIKFASIFPNLQVLDLSNCGDISDESICQVLRCCKIRYLNLTFCKRVDFHGLNFEISKLEVLNLSSTKVDDETLNVISRNCCGLLQLKLNFCNHVTEKGVNRVVEKCTQLRKINLVGCRKLHNIVVDSMLYSRPSIRKIKSPNGFDLSDRKKKLFFDQGCILK
ncbi:F-box/LRR-repeat protein [Trifolium repens]|nr:F-box/LRR-repeat protein [Trifolium repens]